MKPLDLAVGQVVMYYHPDEPEGWMAGTIKSIGPTDAPPDHIYGRSLFIELHNWGDKAASECDVFPIYDNMGYPVTMETYEKLWEQRYEERRELEE